MFLTYIQSIFTYYKVSRKQVPDRDQKNQRRGPFQTIETISTISNQSMEQTPFPSVLKVYAHGAHVRGTKASWGDQKADGPENLLALRAEGTRVSS